MSQAILIMAHQHFEQLVDLTELLSKKFNVYIHIDQNADVDSETISQLNQLTAAPVIQTQAVRWGGYSIAQAAIDLMNLALKDSDNTYFHLISGEDWPLKPLDQIYNFYESSDKIYMNYWRMLDKIKTHEPQIWWVKYYFHYDRMNRRSTFGKIYHRLLLAVSGMLRINKLKKYQLDEDQMYAGQNWVDVPRDALEYALKYYREHPALETVFKSSFCPDEMWLQTVLCNSDYRAKIDKNIHRYIIVRKPDQLHGIKPTVLTLKSDYDAIKKSSNFFGRKFISPDSDTLRQKLTEKNS